MAYNPADLYGMALRQSRVDIGMARGNALTNATNIVIGAGILGKSHEEVLDDIFSISDKIFHYSQVKIDQDFNVWKEANDRQLRLDTGVDIETIYEGESPDFPKKK